MTDKLSGLVLQKGARALLQGRPVVIEAIVDLDLVRVRDLTTEQLVEARIEHLTALPPTSETLSQRPCESEEARLAANDKQEIIEPLLGKAHRTRAEVEARAIQFGYNPSTLYKLIRRAEETGDLRRKQRSDEGKSRFPHEEKYIDEAFNELKALDRTAEKIYAKVEATIKQANAKAKEDFENQRRDGSSTPPRELKLPSRRTISERYRSFSARKKCERLHGRQAAQQEFDPALGSFPYATFPFEVWQIDHVLLDIMVVDDIERKPIGRPWSTISLCPCCRMVMGIELSLDPPGEMSTGLCIGHAILPKERWLEELGCTGEWPIWGWPGAIHGDNAFRLELLKRFCDDDKHRIDIIWRPVKNPRFGGHIERYARTLGEKVHYLPGTTLSDPKARGVYDPEAKATMTESELRQWVVEQILLYHAEVHSSLGMPPIEYYRRAVLNGTATRPAIGLQRRIVDPDEQRRLQLDLMPYEERTVQRYGVRIGKVFYWDDCLRRWINARDPEHPKRKRKFMFRIFKRSLRSIWFYDPELDEYFEIPTRDPSFPDISIWDLKKTKAHAKAEGIRNRQVDEAYIKQRHARQKEIEEQATVKTKAARKQGQRRRGWISAPRPGAPKSVPTPDPISSVSDDDYKRVGEFTEDD